MSDFILTPLSDFGLLKHNTLMALLSESHSALSEFNITEIRQQAGPVVLAWLAPQRLMEWGEEGMDEAATHLQFQFLFVLKIADGPAPE